MTEQVYRRNSCITRWHSRPSNMAVNFAIKCFCKLSRNQVHWWYFKVINPINWQNCSRYIDKRQAYLRWTWVSACFESLPVQFLWLSHGLFWTSKSQWALPLQRTLARFPSRMDIAWLTSSTSWGNFNSLLAAKKRITMRCAIPRGSLDSPYNYDDLA